MSLCILSHLQFKNLRMQLNNIHLWWLEWRRRPAEIRFSGEANRQCNSLGSAWNLEGECSGGGWRLNGGRREVVGGDPAETRFSDELRTRVFGGGFAAHIEGRAAVVVSGQMGGRWWLNGRLPTKKIMVVVGLFLCTGNHRKAPMPPFSTKTPTRVLHIIVYFLPLVNSRLLLRCLFPSSPATPFEPTTVSRSSPYHRQ